MDGGKAETGQRKRIREYKSCGGKLLAAFGFPASWQVIGRGSGQSKGRGGSRVDAPNGTKQQTAEERGPVRRKLELPLRVREMSLSHPDA